MWDPAPLDKMVFDWYTCTLPVQNFVRRRWVCWHSIHIGVLRLAWLVWCDYNVDNWCQHSMILKFIKAFQYLRLHQIDVQWYHEFCYCSLQTGFVLGSYCSFHNYDYTAAELVATPSCPRCHFERIEFQLSESLLLAYTVHSLSFFHSSFSVLLLADEYITRPCCVAILEWIHPHIYHRVPCAE